MDLVELIGRSVDLESDGQAYYGRCPFHAAIAPTLRISVRTQSYRCSGCGASGTVFDWLIEHDGLSFSDALAALT